MSDKLERDFWRSPHTPGGHAYGYYKGNFTIVLHVRIRGIKDKRQDFCAIFYRTGITGNQRGYNPLRVGDTQSTSTRLINGYREKPVLVRIIKLSQDGRRRSKLAARSVVRLYPLDCCPHVSAQACQGIAPQVVNEVARDQEPSIEGGFLVDCGHNGVKLFIGIDFLNDDIRFRLDPCGDFGLESFEMFLGSPDLDCADALGVPRG
jgi:hypothetical protein